MVNCHIALLVLIFGLNTIDACDPMRVVEVPSSGKFELELGPSDFVKNASCYWIIRPDNTNQIIHYKILQFNTPYDSECAAYVQIESVSYDPYSYYKKKKCGNLPRQIGASQGDFGEKRAREFAVEFATHPTENDADVQKRIVKVIFYSIAEDNNGRPIQVDSEYKLEFAKYPTIPRATQWKFKANNPNNTIKFNVEKIGNISCNHKDYIGIVNDTLRRYRGYQGPKYCGNKDDVREKLNKFPPSYELSFFRKKGYELSILLTLVGSAPALHSVCQEEPLIIFVDDVYTLRMPRKVIEETTYAHRFTCRWMIRPKNPAKKLRYEIESLDTPYGNIPINLNYWFEHVSIYPDYFAKIRPRIAGSLDDKISILIGKHKLTNLNGTDADLGSKSPAKQWNVDYKYSGYYFNKGDYKELRIRFTSVCNC
ncbi:uncharacterized protein LOC141912002 [Tubulanus polymorphus]|uniref:uncharacterized protein LOC141912002 n=1 Tax=Tubulanus polymorphus TaxID=672921 RepID=UPI003DA4FBBA